MAPQPQNRRASDNRALDIEGMIQEENDPKQRSFLIVMNNINLSLVANTSTIRDLSEKFDSHLTSYELRTEHEDALLNKGLGAWKVAAWVLGVAQSVVIALTVAAYNDLSSIHGHITALQITDSHVEARLGAMEIRK